MNPEQAARLQRRIKKLSEDAGYMIQPSGMWAEAPFEIPFAVIPHESWRNSWHLSETALLAERCSWHRIYWDEPPKPIVLHYASGAA